MEKQTFYSNGKLLLTGEYLVLNGAVALAIPTKFGQTLTIHASEKLGIQWTSYNHDQQIWLEALLTFEQILKNEKVGDEKVNTLINIIHQAHLLDSTVLHENVAISIETHLTFPRLWGLGTSSTLINNLAQWFKIDAFNLQKMTFGGSGYDIACAKNDSPILYRLEADLPKIKSIAFNPIFKDKLYFVYLNQKQDSQLAVKAFFNKQATFDKPIKQISKITKKLFETNKFNTFCQLLEAHEVIMSEVLEQSTIKESLFSDFNGSIKSLGAWGGDFVLVASEENPMSYFKSKGFHTILSYTDLVK
jgi:mevalonate kinase